MSRQVHRVKRQPEPRLFAFPRDHWEGGTFVEADGTVCEVTCSGKMPSENDWPEGGSVKEDRMPAHGHGRRPRHTT